MLLIHRESKLDNEKSNSMKLAYPKCKDVKNVTNVIAEVEVQPVDVLKVKENGEETEGDSTGDPNTNESEEENKEQYNSTTNGIDSGIYEPSQKWLKDAKEPEIKENISQCSTEDSKCSGETANSVNSTGSFAELDFSKMNLKELKDRGTIRGRKARNNIDWTNQRRVFKDL